MLGKGKGNQKKKANEKQYRFLRKLKIKVSYDPTIPPVSIYTKKTKSLTQKKRQKTAPMFTAALFTIVKT